MKMERSSISIDLKSISCKGVKSFNLFQKPSLYAVVSVGSGGERLGQKQQQKTPVDRSDGENPEWDHPMRFYVGGGDRDLLLEFDLMSSAILGDKVVGRARIPLSDLEFTGALRNASYQVRNPDGKPNGVLSFLYKINNPDAKVSTPAFPPSAVDCYPPPPPPLAKISPPAFPPSAVDCYPPPPPPSAKVSPPAYPPPAVDCYPPPTPPSEKVSLPAYPPPAVDCYPPPPPPSAPVMGYYPPPVTFPAPSTSPFFGYSSAPDPSLCFQAPATGYYPQSDPAYGWPVQTPAVGGYYPPPPPPTHVAYPPQPAMSYPYPAPQGPYGYHPECLRSRFIREQLRDTWHNISGR